MADHGQRRLSSDAFLLRQSAPAKCKHFRRSLPFYVCVLIPSFDFASPVKGPLLLRPAIRKLHSSLCTFTFVAITGHNPVRNLNRWIHPSVKNTSKAPDNPTGGVLCILNPLFPTGFPFFYGVFPQFTKQPVCHRSSSRYPSSRCTSRQLLIEILCSV